MAGAVCLVWFESPQPLAGGSGASRSLDCRRCLHATKRLLDRVREPVMPTVAEPTTALGNWYGTVVFWRPRLALLVNERTLYLVLMPLALATTLMARFPDALQQSLDAGGGVASDFIETEIAAMVDGRYSKTAERDRNRERVQLSRPRCTGIIGD